MWVVVKAKPGQMKRAIKHLERQSFQYYAPKLKYTIVRRHKVVEAERFLFLNYLFVIVEDQWAALRNTSGVSSILMFGDHPSEVNEGVVNDLKAMEGPDGYFHFDQKKKTEKFRPGQRLRVTRGLLEDQFCEFIHYLGVNRARVLFRFGFVVLPLKDLVATAEKKRGTDSNGREAHRAPVYGS